MTRLESNIQTTLARITSRANSLNNASADVSEDSFNKLETALSLLDEAISSTLQFQKSRGKKFISNDDIDNLFKEISGL